MGRRAENGADSLADARAKVLKAALVHVPFDGWSDAVLAQSAREAGVEPGLVKQAFPRGGTDLALEFHRDGDARLADLLAARDFGAMRFRDRVAGAIWLRLELMDAQREVVRRGVALFSLPQNAGLGAKAIWNTADVIWTGLGDTSRDLNWYTKRATLSAVWSAVVLYWLGDESRGCANTRDFIDRRIGDVMRFEGFKARFRDSAFGKAFWQGPGRVLERVRAPGSAAPDDLPGKIS